MKSLFIIMLLLQGCSVWKQKDFKKDMEKPSHKEAEVEVDEKIREKFEVKPVDAEAPKEESKVVEVVQPPVIIQKTGKKPIKVIPPKIVKVIEPEAPKAIKPKIPSDYPADVAALNEKAKKVWDSYKPNHHIDHKVYLDIHYLGMTVGKIMFTNQGKKMINNQEVWHFHARFKSAPFYSNIYELDDTVDTYVTTDKFLSIKYSLIQRESKQDIDDLQLYDRDQLKTFWYYKQKKSDGTVRNKQKEAYVPFYSIDPFSVLFLYQGLPLKNGDTFEIPIINKAKILVLKSVVEGRETIETEKGKIKSIRVHATTKYSGEHLKDGDLYFWFSDDEKRTLLKARAKIKIGNVTADIVEG
ncbi:MAG TPA: DUF3108 domain-containing protein [Bacteriovoracaceae bacterium]|nr:DUF3108 domain-containing protein [Bacteriovoracaceae bacterium]